MVDRILGNSPSAQQINGPERQKNQLPADGGKPGFGSAFADALQTEVEGGLRFSTHAQQRLRSREIELTKQDEADLAQAVEAASKKGAQESLILFDDLALIVSIRNKVVITAMEREPEQSNVFTNIDSAVVWRRNRLE